MPTLELSGGRTATYEVVGRGDPALLLPGGPGAAASYMSEDARLFADVFTCYLVDPHGSGGSSPPASPDGYRPEGHARFYDDVRAALGLERVTVLGHSFGGGVALAYAALHPRVTERCISVGGFAVGTEADAAEGGAAAAEMEAMLARHADAPWYGPARAVWDSWTERALGARSGAEIDDMMRVVLPLYAAHPDRPSVRARLTAFAESLAFDLAAIKAWEGGVYQGVDLRPLLERISAPTLVVTGELDLICGPAQARAIAAHVRDADLVLLPECGHWPVAEDPDAYARAVVDWLRAHPVG